MAERHIVIAGPMGVGKSTLAEKLADEIGGEVYLESDGAGNPFLENYYAEPSKWAFHSQAFFLSEALQQQAAIARAHGDIIQDRHLYEHLAMFAAPKFENGEMSNDEYALLGRIVDACVDSTDPPSLLIYAHASAPVILDRIRERGRSYEQHITLEDVSAPLKRYERFVLDWKLSPVLRIDTSEIDARTPEGIGQVATMMRQALHRPHR
jgi:deoxyadenosine/deoxycytidine kinase